MIVSVTLISKLAGGAEGAKRDIETGGQYITVNIVLNSAWCHIPQNLRSII